MNVFLWNARARNGQVEATLNHPFPAQAATPLEDELKATKNRLDVARAEIDLLRRQAAKARAEAEATRTEHKRVEVAEQSFCTLFGFDVDFVCADRDDLLGPQKTITLDRPAKIGPAPTGSPPGRRARGSRIAEAERIRV